MKQTIPGLPEKLMCAWLFFFLVIGIGTASIAQEAKADKAPLNKELLETYSKKIDINYIVPRPAVIKKILKDKNFSFTGTVDPNFTANYSSNAKTALNLGVRCTDGIMMLYGNEKATGQKLEKLGATIMKLTEDLGLKGKLKDIETLKAAIRSDNQENIRSSIDSLFAESETFLRQRDDGELAMLVSMGGWIELMYHASEELARNYQPEASKVLAMDYIVDVYIQSLSDLELFIQDTPALAAIAGKLPELRKLMSHTGNEPLPQDTVQGIYNIAKNLKHEIERP